MQDPKLLEATASEPLNLEKEYDNQESWRKDHDKLTFIICLPVSNVTNDPTIKATIADGDDRMLGDINLFLRPEDSDDDELVTSATSSDTTLTLCGELNLMIASEENRHVGYGKAALLAFMHYILRHRSDIASEYAAGTEEPNTPLEPNVHPRPNVPPSLAYLCAKISEENERSIHLFSSMGFKQHGEVSHFKEVEMRWYVNAAMIGGLPHIKKPRELRYQLDE